MIFREVGARSYERGFDISRFRDPKALRSCGRTAGNRENHGTKKCCLAANRHRLFPQYFLPYDDRPVLPVYRKASFAQTDQACEPMFRLKQKHSQHLHETNTPVSAERLIAEQSVRAAITGAATTIIVFNILWAYTASASGKFFPWIAIIQGIAIGFAVRKAGRGLDWRFPLVAGLAAWAGAFSGNLFIALAFTGAQNAVLDDGWWQIVKNFYLNTITVIDVIYAFCAVAVATFYSKRRLNRHEVFALRKHVEDK